MPVLAFALVLVLQGCSSSGGTPTGPSVSSGVGCAAFAAALCDEYQRCVPALLLSSWGTKERCEASVETSCQPTIGAPGSHATADTWKKCADDLLVSRCGSPVSPAACVPRGDLARGAPCAFSAQCETAFCSGSNVQCGICVSLAPDLTTYSDVDGPCGTIPTVRCLADLYCDDATKRCRAQVKEVGQSCAGGVECSPAFGLYCADSGTCALAKTGTEGSACSSGSAPLCSDFTACRVDTCVRRAELGQSCSDFVLCAPTLSCVDGKCGALNAESCK